MTRYRNLQIDFYDPDLNFLSGGSTRQLLSVQASSLLSGVGTFSCSYPWPLNVSPAFGTLEKIGNIVSFSYQDFNSGVGTPGHMRTLGEAYLIETLEASNTSEGQIIRLTGRSLISELERVLAWEPIGELHTFNTTLKIAVVGKFYKSLAAPALQGDDKITLNSTADVGETDMLEIPLTSGGMAYVIVSSVEGSVVTLTGGMPGAANNGASVGVMTRKITPNSVEGMNKGSKLTLTLDSGSYTTIIQEGPQEESGGGDQYVILRDPVPGNAAIGKAIVVQDRSEPAQDDIEQIMAQAPEWTQAALGLTWYGSAHNPEGQPVLDLLQTVSGMRNLPFRLALLPTTNLPTRELVWGTHESGSTPGYTLAIGNPPAATALNYRQQNFGIAAGGISNEESGPIYSRVYPTSGDESVSLYGVSANMTPVLDPYVLVNNPATLGLYARPYIKNPALEATGYIASKTESFSHITSETAGMDAYMTASDMLALEAMTWLAQHSGGGYNWKLRDVTITSSVQQFPGQRVDIHYYDSSSQVKPSHTYHLREDLIITEMSWTWDSESNRPRLDMTLNSRAIVSNSATRYAQKLRTYDRTVARVASGGIEGRSVIVKTVTPSVPAPPPVTGSYLPLAGGHMTGNITLDASRTVDGVDISAHAADPNAHHAAVTLSNTGLSLSGQALGLLLDANPGLVIGAGGVKVNLATNAGMLLSGDQLLMGTPTTLSATSVNGVSGTTHTHQISHTNDAVTFANNIMSTGISGEMSVKRIGVGATSVSTAIALFQNISTSQHTIQVKQISGQTGDLWRIENTSGGALIRLTGGGDLESGQPGFVSGLTGWQITHDGNAEFNNAFIRGELHATTFVADEMHATGGTIAVMTVAKVAPPVNVNDNKLPGLGSTFVLNLEDSWATGVAYVTSGDVLRLKPMGQLSSGGSLSLYDIYLEVVSAGSQTGRNLNPASGDVSPGYRPTTVRRLRGGANNFVIPQATAAVKWGKIGGSGFTGGLILTSDLNNAPYIDVFTVDATKSSGQWQSTDPSTFILPRVRMGNLKGVLGKSVDEWGIAMATNLSDTEVISRSLVVSNDGITLRNADLRAYSGSAPRLYFASSGTVKLGTNIEDATSTTFEFDAVSGHTRLGAYGEGLPHILWDNASGSLRIRNYFTDVIRFNSDGDSYFAGVMTIGTSGEIRQGVGTPGTTGAWPSAGSSWGTFTGLRIGRSSSVGRLAVYNNGEYQFFTGTDGVLYAGAGGVQLDSSGITLRTYDTASPGWLNMATSNMAIKFRRTEGTYTGHIASIATTTGGWQAISVSASSSGVHHALISTSGISLQTTGSIDIGRSDQYTSGVRVYSSGSIQVYGNIVVQTGSSIITPQLSASGGVDAGTWVLAGTYIRSGGGLIVGSSVPDVPPNGAIYLKSVSSQPTVSIGSAATIYVVQSGATYTLYLAKPGGSATVIATV